MSAVSMNDAQNNRVQPDAFATNNNDLSLPPRNDPLNILDSQGRKIIIDAKTDPLGALVSTHGGFPRTPHSVDLDRLAAKTENAFSLASVHDHDSVEKSRSDKLAKI